MRYVNWWYENIVVITFEGNEFVPLKMTTDHDGNISIHAVDLDDVSFEALEKAGLINSVQKVALCAAVNDERAEGIERAERQRLSLLLKKYPLHTSEE